MYIAAHDGQLFLSLRRGTSPFTWPGCIFVPNKDMADQCPWPSLGTIVSRRDHRPPFRNRELIHAKSRSSWRRRNGYRVGCLPTAKLAMAFTAQSARIRSFSDRQVQRIRRERWSTGTSSGATSSPSVAPKEAFDLDLVDRMIAANQHGHGFFPCAGQKGPDQLGRERCSGTM